jgi:cadmium resistance protein CadD (predicted permease)
MSFGDLSRTRLGRARVRARASRGRLKTRNISHSQVWSVAAVTTANGGDNLAVYIPVFASRLSAIPIDVVIFATMTGIWCVAGYLLVNNPIAGAHIRRYGHIVLPFVLIALGIWILRDAAR